MSMSTLCHAVPGPLALVAALLAVSPVRAAEPAKDALARSAAAFTAMERAEVEKLSTALDALIADPAFVEPFRARDRARLLAVARPRFEKLEAEQLVTHWYFIEPEPSKTCFLRVHSPDTFGDVIARDTLAAAIATKQVGSGKELGKTAFALRVVKPIRVAGEVVGYMELGEEIGHFLARLKAQTGDDFAILADKGRIDRKELAKLRGEDRWDERRDVVLIESTVWNEATVDLGAALEKIPDGGTRIPAWIDGSGRYVGGAFPVRDAANRLVGALFVRRAADKK
ncbi:MAG TPA: cache domain-containing protein [Anaeromyxobacter sp.]